MPFVPVVDLTDPEREPSDEELEALMQSVCEKVVENNRRARERFLADLKDSIARAAQGGTDPVPDAVRRADAARQAKPETTMTGTAKPDHEPDWAYLCENCSQPMLAGDEYTVWWEGMWQCWACAKPKCGDAEPLSLAEWKAGR